MDFFLKDKGDHQIFSDFFKNPELQFQTQSTSEDLVPCAFSHYIEREDMPHFGNGKEYLSELKFSKDLQANLIINKSVKNRDHYAIE